MPPTEVQHKILVRVLRTFLGKFGESTPRQELVIEFQNLRDLDDLAYRHVLKSYAPTGDDYLPTALAFHYCVDAEIEKQPRKAVQILAKVLRKQFLSRQIRLSREGLEEGARAIGPSCDQKTIELGIYLGPDFNLFQSYAGGNEAKPVITPTQISERIVEITSPDTLWDDFMRDSRPWPSQDSFGGVVSATVPLTSQIDNLLPKPRATDRSWSRADKIAAAALIVAIITVVVGVTVPEVRVWFHLDKPTGATVSAPIVPSTDAEAKKILSDYAARLHDLDRLVKEADSSTDIETKGADSILVYRIAYGAAEYRTSLPEFQNVPWATLIRKLEGAGVPDSTTDAIEATDTLMNGPYVGQDTHKRGYFGPGILDAQVSTLQAYYNAAHNHVYGQ